jgi:hypothetical protein
LRELLRFYNEITEDTHYMIITDFRDYTLNETHFESYFSAGCFSSNANVCVGTSWF